jgi:hypothetical protein
LLSPPSHEERGLHEDEPALGVMSQRFYNSVVDVLHFLLEILVNSPLPACVVMGVRQNEDR